MPSCSSRLRQPTTLDPGWQAPPGRAAPERTPGAVHGLAIRLQYAAPRPVTAPWGSSRFSWGSTGCQAWFSPLSALGGRQHLCTSKGIRLVRLPEINIRAVAHRAMWGYGVDPPADINPPSGSGACQPDPAGAAAGGHHGVHGSVLRRQRPAEPAGSAGRGAGLCGTSCVSRTAEVVRPFDLSPSSGPSREVPERSTAGQ